ncbi:MAG: flippase-like domain-containing protein [Planctomycetaceae bacterium]|jgi:uncharacterized membrane protein YbhN (UPF0104 family)|nr:flippase-like domain-containing protein [Planctomycetaceae bacterium]
MSKYKKHIVFVFKIVILALVAIWVYKELNKSWGELSKHTWDFHYGWLLLSGVLYAVAYLPPCAFWFFIMRRLGQRPAVLTTLRAYYIGHLGKYVPGKAVVVLLRAGLVKSERVSATFASIAVFFETLLMMAVGGFISAAIILVWFRENEQHTMLVLAAIAMMVVTALPIYPPVFRAVTKRIKISKTAADIDEKLQNINLLSLAYGWCLMCVTWILLGCCLWASIRGLGFETGSLTEHLPRFTAAVALSTVLGFLAMMPGGIGVRDWALAQLLTFYFAALATQQLTSNNDLTPETIALVVAAVQRMISILTELAVSSVLLPLGRKRTYNEHD